MWEGLKIVLLSVLAAITYGVLHDQITARICVEYFTIGHVRMWPTDNPTMHGLIWGVIATWWVGAFLGLLLAVAGRFGPGRKRTWRELVRPLRNVLIATAVLATLVGIATALLAFANDFQFGRRWGSSIPREKHAAFLTCLMIHNASYLGAAVFGLTLVLWVARSRWKVVDREAWERMESTR